MKRHLSALVPFLAMQAKLGLMPVCRRSCMTSGISGTPPE